MVLLWRAVLFPICISHRQYPVSFFVLSFCLVGTGFDRKSCLADCSHQYPVKCGYCFYLISDGPPVQPFSHCRGFGWDCVSFFPYVLLSDRAALRINGDNGHMDGPGDFVSALRISQRRGKNKGFMFCESMSFVCRHLFCS